MRRTREEIIQTASQKALRQLGQMVKNRRIEDTERKVRVSSNFLLEIDCDRSEGDDFLEVGTPLRFQIYAVISGKDHDCVTMQPVMYADFLKAAEKEILYLLNCYVRD